MTKLCKNCGAPVPDEARFCPECGKSVEPKAVCPHCGESLRTGDRFCIHCGHAVADGQAGTAHAPADAPRQEADHGVVYRKRCPECGTLVDETADQCGQCGYQFGRKSTGILDGRMRCPSCGQEIPDTARVCPECGCQLDRQGGRRGQGSMTGGTADERGHAAEGSA